MEVDPVEGTVVSPVCVNTCIATVEPRLTLYLHAVGTVEAL